jgi:hypothetical protein
VIFLLSTGASIPAQIGGVQSLVHKFLQELQEEDRKSYFETTNKIRMEDRSEPSCYRYRNTVGDDRKTGK